MTPPTVFDWIDTGLLVLRDVGAAGLTVERICKEMRRTKGSFYHHFHDVESFHGSVLAEWRALQSRPPTDEGLVADRLRNDDRLDHAVRAWALYDPTARRALDEVDAQRLAVLETRHAAAGHEAPRDLALLEYGLILGLQALGVAPDVGARVRARLGKSAL